MNEAAPDSLLIRGGIPLRGDVRLGPDRAILETTLAIAALARGRSELHAVCAGLQPQAASTRAQTEPRDASGPQLAVAVGAWAQLGVECRLAGSSLSVESPGLDALQAPTGAIECGASPRLLAQLSGVLAGQRFGTQLRAAGCSDTPVGHWLEVLRARGAHIAARGGGENAKLFPPVSVAPLLESERLHALDASLPFCDAVGKDAILLNALFAAGPTLLSEPHVSSDHLERALVQVGLPLRRIGSVVSLDTPAWSRELPGLGHVHIPGSATQAAVLAALVHALPGSDVTLRGVSVNPAQSGVLDVLRSWGGALTWNLLGDAALREPVADLRVRNAHEVVAHGAKEARPAAVRGGVADADLLLRCGEAAPLLWLIGAHSKRGVRLCDLNVLHAQQRDPGWSKLDALFAAFGVNVERAPNEVFIPQGELGTKARARAWDARGDAQTALAACALALATPGETVVEHALEALSALYPGFIRAAQELGASIERV